MTDSPPAAGNISYREKAMLKALGEALVRLEQRLDESSSVWTEVLS
jgi:hypothetical protein